MAARLTALRRERPGRVLLEVDGRPWRAVPDDVVVRVGLARGIELERHVLRALRRELRRADALRVATRVIARSDASARRVTERLERAGIPPPMREATIARLTELGAIDDARVASATATSLAERGWGDDAIVARLEAAGVARELADEAG